MESPMNITRLGSDGCFFNSSLAPWYRPSWFQSCSWSASARAEMARALAVPGRQQLLVGGLNSSTNWAWATVQISNPVIIANKSRRRILDPPSLGQSEAQDTAFAGKNHILLTADH